MSVNIAEYIYCKIPTIWIPTYRKLIFLLNKEGKNLLDDCNYICKNSGKNIFTCWSMFQSAIASYNDNNIKQANLLIDYITKEIDSKMKNYTINPDELECINSTNYPIVTVNVDKDGYYHFNLAAKDKRYANENFIVEKEIILPEKAPSVWNIKVRRLSPILNESNIIQYQLDIYDQYGNVGIIDDVSKIKFEDEIPYFLNFPLKDNPKNAADYDKSKYLLNVNVSILRERYKKEQLNEVNVIKVSIPSTGGQDNTTAKSVQYVPINLPLYRQDFYDDSSDVTLITYINCCDGNSYEIDCHNIILDDIADTLSFEYVPSEIEKADNSTNGVWSILVDDHIIGVNGEAKGVKVIEESKFKRTLKFSIDKLYDIKVKFEFNDKVFMKYVEAEHGIPVKYFTFDNVPNAIEGINNYSGNNINLLRKQNIRMTTDKVNNRVGFIAHSNRHLEFVQAGFSITMNEQPLPSNKILYYSDELEPGTYNIRVSLEDNDCDDKHCNCPSHVDEFDGHHCCPRPNHHKHPLC